MSDLQTIASLLEAMLAVVEPAAIAIADQQRTSAAVEAGAAPGGVGGAGGAARSSPGLAGGKPKDVRRSFTFRAGTDAIGQATSPFQTATSAGVGFGISATSGILGSGLTQALLNVTGVGQELQAQQNAEAQLRQIVGRNARAGVQFDDDDISRLSAGLKRLEDLNTKAQEQVSRVLGGEQASGLVDAVTKAADRAITRLEQLFTLANPNVSGGFLDPGG